MNTKLLIIVAAAILAACSSSNRIITITINEVTAKLFRDKNASKLAMQLANINYPATVTHEGDTVNIHVGQAPVRDVRRSICRQFGWPSFAGKMARIDDTLRNLRNVGITKLKLIGDTETLEVELEKDGRCRKTS